MYIVDNIFDFFMAMADIPFIRYGLIALWVITGFVWMLLYDSVNDPSSNKNKTTSAIIKRILGIIFLFISSLFVIFFILKVLINRF